MVDIAIIKNLAMKEGSSDKVYNVSLHAESGSWGVQVNRGRRGSTLIVDNKTSNGPVDYNKALGIFTKLVNEKIGKGYKESENNIPSPSYTAPEQREQTDLVAMLLNEVDEDDLNNLFDSPEWVMQEKMDGRRMIISVKDGVLKAVNRRGQVCGIPSNVESDILAINDNIVLDGECVGEEYYAFDILTHKNVDLRQKPYNQRLDHLYNIEKSLNPNKSWFFLNATLTSDRKKIMYDFIKSQGGEGVVFKNKNSKYSSGRPSSGGNALKFKFVKTLSAIVVGVNAKRSISVGLFNDENNMIAMGNVTVPPNQPIPGLKDIVEVRYLYAYRGGSLYQPFLIGIRDDIDASACTMKQVKYKNEAENTEDLDINTPRI